MKAVDLAPGYDCIIRASKDGIISIIMALDVKVSERNSRFNDLFIEHKPTSFAYVRNCITRTNCNYTDSSYTVIRSRDKVFDTADTLYVSQSIVQSEVLPLNLWRLADYLLRRISKSALLPSRILR